jgi:hypothetical protein
MVSGTKLRDFGEQPARGGAVWSAIRPEGVLRAAARVREASLAGARPPLSRPFSFVRSFLERNTMTIQSELLPGERMNSGPPPVQRYQARAPCVAALWAVPGQPGRRT